LPSLAEIHEVHEVGTPPIATALRRFDERAGPHLEAFARTSNAASLKRDRLQFFAIALALYECLMERHAF
jgi:hypothetical protein